MAFGTPSSAEISWRPALPKAGSENQGSGLFVNGHLLLNCYPSSVRYVRQAWVAATGGRWRLVMGQSEGGATCTTAHMATVPGMGHAPMAIQVIGCVRVAQNCLVSGRLPVEGGELPYTWPITIAFSRHE